MCEKAKRVKTVFNIANFGFSRYIFSAFCQPMNGDVVFRLFGDPQDLPELLPEFIKKWEDGAKVVLGRKSDDNIFMRLMRNGYYFIVDRLSDRKQIEHFNGYGLYNKMFVDIMKQIEDPQPYLKTIVFEADENGNVQRCHPWHHQCYLRHIRIGTKDIVLVDLSVGGGFSKGRDFLLGQCSCFLLEYWENMCSVLIPER